jgi:hypothetical protein
MNALRTVREARINFIFFQDIITCVMGILILITLMLSLSLDAGATPEEQQLETELRTAKATLAEVEQQNREAQQKALQLASLPDRALLETELATLQLQSTNTAKQLLRSQTNAAAQKSEQSRATNLEETVSALEKQAAALHAQIAEARRATNSIYIVPSAEARQSAREPVAIVVNRDTLRLLRLNGAAEDRAINSGAADLRALLSPLNPEREYLVFYFRPSGAKWFVEFRELARSLGFAVGYDAVEEQQEIKFSAP